VWRIAPREACALRSELAHAQLNGALDPVLVEPEQDPLLAAAIASLPPRVWVEDPRLGQCSGMTLEPLGFGPDGRVKRACEPPVER
jgi:hypothetical protein